MFQKYSAVVFGGRRSLRLVPSESDGLHGKTNGSSISLMVQSTLSIPEIGELLAGDN